MELQELQLELAINISKSSKPFEINTDCTQTEKLDFFLKIWIVVRL